jgi:hypothetical protein
MLVSMFQSIWELISQLQDFRVCNPLDLDLSSCPKLCYCVWMTISYLTDDKDSVDTEDEEEAPPTPSDQSEVTENTESFNLGHCSSQDASGEIDMF